MGGVIDISPGASCAHTSRLSLRVNPNPVESRHVDDEPSVTGPQARPIVPAASHSGQNLVVPCEIYAGHYIGDVCTLGDECGELVDHPVVDGPSIVVAGITWLDEGPAKRLAKERNRRLVECLLGVI
jgi:hypothetical protein